MTPPAAPPSPEANPILLGHDEAMRQVAAAYASGRLHHAWLIAGPDGIGKATLAFHIAHFVLSGGAAQMGQLDLSLPAARLVAGMAHPDLFILRRPYDEKTGVQKDTIPVEEARKLEPFLRKTATYGGWRVAIIDEAHALNRFGQNTILKLIEEPPPKSLILITTRSAGAVLPTIRSRTRSLALSPLAPPHLRAALLRLGVEPDGLGAAGLALAGGSVGFALKILESESLPLFDELHAILCALPDMDPLRVQALADKIAKKADADSFAVLTTLSLQLIRESVRRAAFQEGGDACLALPLDRALQVWDKVSEIFALAEAANLDHKLAFISAIHAVQRAYQGL